jgi:hypothetical protein
MKPVRGSSPSVIFCSLSVAAHWHAGRRRVVQKDDQRDETSADCCRDRPQWLGTFEFGQDEAELYRGRRQKPRTHNENRVTEQHPIAVGNREERPGCFCAQVGRRR